MNDWLIAAALALLLSSSGCTLVSELSNSSGCMYTAGGPMGIASGVVVVCRSGKDQADVEYADRDRSIIIRHNGGASGFQ